MDHLSQLKETGLNFSCVVMDSWYFCKSLITHIESLDKDWVAECRDNRLIRSGKRWITLKEFGEQMLRKENFRIVGMGKDRYLMKAFTVFMKGIGTVRVLVSYNKHDNFKFYVTNRLDWGERKIAEMYSRRWDIEVWHREGKGDYGIGECQLRSDEAVSRYLTLISLAACLLEIASLHSPLYAMLKSQARTPEAKRRWILLELISQLISFASKVKDGLVKTVAESVVYPYRSTLKDRSEVMEAIGMIRGAGKMRAVETLA